MSLILLKEFVESLSKVRGEVRVESPRLWGGILVTLGLDVGEPNAPADNNRAGSMKVKAS